MNQQQINMLNSPDMKHHQVNGVNVNGRVDLLSPNTSTLFSMTDRIPLSKSTDFRDAMKGNKDSYYHQVFFHYVRRNGHCVQHAYDRG